MQEMNILQKLEKIGLSMIFEFIPGKACVSTDPSCTEIIYNSAAAQFLEMSFVQLVQEDKRDEAQKFLVEQMGPAGAVLNAQLQEHNKFRLNQINTEIDEAVANAEQAKLVAVIAAIFAAVIIGFLSARSIQSVSASTEEQLASMQEIASASQALAKLAQNLQTTVAVFHV